MSILQVVKGSGVNFTSLQEVGCQFNKFTRDRVSITEISKSYLKGETMA